MSGNAAGRRCPRSAGCFLSAAGVEAADLLWFPKRPHNRVRSVLSRLFISHSSLNNAAAMALCKWLAEQGYDDVFLDINPERGLVAGERWQEALKAAADRCEAVLFLVSPAWLGSQWCRTEFLLAKTLHKRIFGLIIEPVPLDQVPPEMKVEWLKKTPGRIIRRRIPLFWVGAVSLHFGAEMKGLSARVTYCRLDETKVTCRDLRG